MRLFTGLFHRAIAQSGSALGCWSRGQRSAPLIAKALGLETVSEKEILKILQEMPVEKLFELQEKIPDVSNITRNTCKTLIEIFFFLAFYSM